MVEPLSLDEAYLDVSDYPSATLIAEEIRAKIKAQTQLTASAGISINKFLAKIASDWNKPDGQKTLPPEEIIAFLESLDVKKFHGIGKNQTQNVPSRDLYRERFKSAVSFFLTSHFGKSGVYYYDVVRGNSQQSSQAHRIPKSVGIERTFCSNLSSELFLEDKLKELAENLERRLKKNKVAGKTLP